ncbi:MAG: hypothetical protein KGN77_11145, partial [Xanthomonadaceae bacterium]|nr:hypothetical protein [Xanthomonadaceae bacterium]
MRTNQSFPLEQVFREAHLALLGASFAEFQENPQGTLEKYGKHEAIAIMRLGYRPLLPVQVRLRETLMTQWRADGTWEDCMLLHPASPTKTNRHHQRIRQVVDTMLDLVRRRLIRHSRTTVTGGIPDQAARTSA